MRAFKRFIWLALAACLVSSVFRGCKGTDEKDDVDESDVVVLNSSNIDTFMQQHDGVLVRRHRNSLPLRSTLCAP